MPDDPTAAEPRPRPRWRRIVDSPWFHLAAAVVVTGLVLSLLVKPYLVPSGSMAQTLEVGDRVLVLRPAYVAAEPATGDVIVFEAYGVPVEIEIEMTRSTASTSSIA